LITQTARLFPSEKSRSPCREPRLSSPSTAQLSPLRDEQLTGFFSDGNQIFRFIYRRRFRLAFQPDLRGEQLTVFFFNVNRNFRFF